MNTMTDKKTSWWNEPMVWLLIALPISAVIGGAVTIWFATTNADALVSEDHYKVGFAVHQGIELDRKAAELAVVAMLKASDGQLTLSLQGTFDRPPSGLALTLSRPGSEQEEMVLKLEQAGELDYSAPYVALPEGDQRLVLTPADKTWRVIGYWQAPFTGSTRLVPADPTVTPPHSSTQP